MQETCCRIPVEQKEVNQRSRDFVCLIRQVMESQIKICLKSSGLSRTLFSQHVFQLAKEEVLHFGLAAGI